MTTNPKRAADDVGMLLAAHGDDEAEVGPLLEAVVGDQVRAAEALATAVALLWAMARSVDDSVLGFLPDPDGEIGVAGSKAVQRVLDAMAAGSDD